MTPIVRRWLALLLVIAATTPMLLAGDGEHDKDTDHGRLLDPIVGSWLVHATFLKTTIAGFPALPFESVELAADFEDGTVITTVGGGSAPAHGVWKRSGLPRTYEIKFLYVPSGPQYPPGTIGTSFVGPLILNQAGTQLTGPFNAFSTGPDGKVIDTLSGTVVNDRISFTSSP